MMAQLKPLIRSGPLEPVSAGPSEAESAANLKRWYMAMEASHEMLIAGLRDRVGPDGDVRQAYRDWMEKHRAEKVRAYDNAAKRHHDRMTARQRELDAS